MHLLQDHDDDEEEEGVLHEERFDRNPSKKFDQHHTSMQQMQITLSHIWHRLPFAKVLTPLLNHSASVVDDNLGGRHWTAVFHVHFVLQFK